MIDECAPKLEAVFGKVTDENGRVDRKVLGEKAFSSEENLKKLNCIAHKSIMAKVSEIMDENRGKGIFNFTVDGAALFEAGAKETCDFILLCILSMRPMKVSSSSSEKPENIFSSAAEKISLVRATISLPRSVISIS